MTSDPTGIDCGSVCSASYNSDTVVSLTVAPDINSDFAGWSGDADCTDGQVAMNADRICLAMCNLKTQNYTLTIKKEGTGNGTETSSPKGIDCGSDCIEMYEKVKKPKKVTLKVKPMCTLRSLAGVVIAR